MMHDTPQRPRIAVLSTADWERPVWTNKQHLAARLARTTDVTFINSTGLRWPQFTPSDVRRIRERVFSRVADGHTTPPRLTVIRPGTLPMSDNPAIRLFNAVRLRRRSTQWLRSPNGRVLWTFSPYTCGLERYADLTVYHSVDLLHHFPGVPQDALLNAERALAAKGITAIASSSVVRNHLEEVGFEHVLYWPNVADVDLYRHEAAKSSREPGTVIFAGNLLRGKVDLPLLSSLLDCREVTKLIVAGPRGEGGQAPTGLDVFLKHPKVEDLGILAPEQLAQAMGRATIGVIPYQITEYTEGVYPMKLDEYRAAGCLVVSTPLPSIGGAAGIIFADRSTFRVRVAQYVRQSLNVDQPERDWESRLNQAWQLIEQLTVAGPRGGS